MNLFEPLKYLPLAKFLLHVSVLTRYGWFRDEFYYLACADHLAWGYVDHPPLSIAILRLWSAIMGDSLAAVRLAPALAGAAVVFVTGCVARELGAGTFGQALAMLAIIVAPAYLAINHFYSMNSFDALFWTIAGLMFVKMIRVSSSGSASPGSRERAYALLGAVVGLGLLNKLSMLWLAAGLLVAILASPLRRDLRTRAPWIGAAVAGLLFAPHVLWQVTHGWPTVEFMRNAAGTKMKTLMPLAFVQAQVLLMHPLVAVLAATGLAWLLFGRGRPFRPLALAVLVVIVILTINRTSRPEYLAAAYPLLVAPGAMFLEQIVRWRAARAAMVAGLVIAGMATAPLAMPLLDVDRYIAYANALGIKPGTSERKALGDLPQHFADMHGWDEIVAAVARVASTLSADERREAIVFTQNYGEAGAIDRLGRIHGLPPAVSGHNNYFLWGLRGRSASTAILVGGEREDYFDAFREVTQAAVIECGRCMPYENGQAIFIGRQPHRPVAEVFPDAKHYD